MVSNWKLDSSTMQGRFHRQHAKVAIDDFDPDWSKKIKCSSDLEREKRDLDFL
jgi:hypothetical protein